MSLSDFFKSNKSLPADSVMITKALEILALSPHGQQLVNFVEKKDIIIKIIATPQQLSYLPESGVVCIGINKNNPGSPSRFILALAGILREAQQEAAGIKHPPLHAPLSEHMDISLAKQEDKVWYMCAIACELAGQEIFTEYKFLDELKKMGHNEALELYIDQELKNSN